MCSNCEKNDFVVVNNWKTCTNCGLESDYVPKYYVSYALPRREYRRQYYSRAKRFTKVLWGMKSDLIGQYFEEILQSYSFIEFLWNMKPNKSRKYFFSQKVILWYILDRLQIPVVVPVLKNKERSNTQIRSINELL